MATKSETRIFGFFLMQLTVGLNRFSASGGHGERKKGPGVAVAQSSSTLAEHVLTYGEEEGK